MPEADTSENSRISSRRGLAKSGSVRRLIRPKRASPLQFPKVKVYSSTRVYKAPQALVRNDKYVGTKQESSVGTRRRRRRQVGGGPLTEVLSVPEAITDYKASDHDSDYSIGSVDELPAPPLWSDNEDFDGISPYTQKKDTIPEIAWARTPPSAMKTHLIARSGCEDISDNAIGEEDLFAAYGAHLHTHLHTHDHISRCCPKGKKRKCGLLQRYSKLLQLCAFLLLAFIVFDSRHRMQEHKVQLQEYDEEKAHILQQMMWMDQAAKKVHRKYSQPGSEPPPRAKGPAAQYREDIEKLQLRIQLNARDRLAQRFGDKPAEISLKLGQGEHLIVALSDDTPHAVSILLEQVERHMWDSIRIESSSAVGAIQIASKKAATSPLLEFVEPSRGCHEEGSVAIRQQVDRGLHVLKLRVNLIANSPMEDGDVCIGRVVSSLATLLGTAESLSIAAAAALASS